MQTGQASGAAHFGPAGRALDQGDGVRGAQLGASAAVDAGGQRVERGRGARFLVPLEGCGQKDADGIAVFGMHAFALPDALGHSSRFELGVGQKLPARARRGTCSCPPSAR